MLKSANNFGTPQYLLDKVSQKERANFFINTFRKELPQTEFFYAFKCNDFPQLIKTLKEQGFNADVAGIYELQLALKMGFEKIIFTSPGKSDSEILLSLKESKKVILNIDNKDELLRLTQLIQKSNFQDIIKISFRLNPLPTTMGIWSKFGINLIEFKEIINIVKKNHHLNWIGLHFHCSWNKTPTKYIQNINALSDFIHGNISSEDINHLEFIDIGGGFFPEDTAIINKIQDKGILLDIINEHHDNPEIYKELNFDPHLPELRPVKPLDYFATEIAKAIKEKILLFNNKLKIFLEPGRFLATHSTSILLKVIAKKGNNVIVDGGINMVGDYRFEEYSYAPIVNLSRPSNQLKKQTIYGPLCDPSDLWGYSYYGTDLQVGDILAVLHQGAYTFSFAWRFIKPISPYVVMDEENIKLGKKEESFEDRYGGCDLD